MSHISTFYGSGLKGLKTFNIHLGIMFNFFSKSVKTILKMFVRDGDEGVSLAPSKNLRTIWKPCLFTTF